MLRALFNCDGVIAVRANPAVGLVENRVQIRGGRSDKCGRGLDVGEQSHKEKTQ